MKRELFAAAAIPIMVVTIGWLPPWGFLTILWVAALLACDARGRSEAWAIGGVRSNDDESCPDPVRPYG